MTFVIGKTYQFQTDGTQFTVLNVKMEKGEINSMQVKYLNATTKVGARWINPHKNTKVIVL